MRSGLLILWPVGDIPQAQEEIFCNDFCRKKTLEMAKKCCAKVEIETYSQDSDLGDIVPRNRDFNLFLVIADPRIVVSSDGIKSLLELAGSSSYVLGPVYNATDFSLQMAELDVPYLNMSSFQEKAADLWIENRDKILDAVELDSGCVIYSISTLRSLSFPWERLTPREAAAHPDIPKRVHCGALAHRFENYFEAYRNDLVDMVPGNVSSILDVGCSCGNYGYVLKKKKPELFVAGVEPNHSAAQKARQYYDQVITGRIEDCNFNVGFDLINCGDVLEHLEDTWSILAQMHGMLKNGGYLVLSVPNAGHWTLVADLLKGRFEYIPAGIQCSGHIRWFTRESIVNALHEAGFDVETLKCQQIPPTTKGEAFVDFMVMNGLGDRESLLTNEFLIRAVKK